MRLRRHKRDWEDLAVVDPLWAILTDPRRQNGRWQLGEFFETGTAEIASILRTAAELDYPKSQKRALDFGCGVGRTTRALAAFFEECIGVDISERMVAQARRLNVDRTSCTFLVNVEPNLRQFESSGFDFVYSNLVLQHQPSRQLAQRYIGELLRVLRPGGLLVFQMPSFIPWRHRLQLGGRLYRGMRRVGLSAEFLYRRARVDPLRMIFLPEREIRAIVARHGGTILHTETADDQQGPIRGFFYFVRTDRDGSPAGPAPDASGLTALKSPR